MMRPLSLIALLVICFAPRSSSAAVPYIADPVEALRQVLRTPIRDPGNRDELLWRQEQLKARAKALGVGDLRRALLLQEWRYEDREEAIAAVDKPVRDGIVNRLIGALRKVLQSKHESAKLAGIARSARWASPSSARTAAPIWLPRWRRTGEADERSGPHRSSSCGPGNRPNQSRPQAGNRGAGQLARFLRRRRSPRPGPTDSCSCCERLPR